MENSDFIIYTKFTSSVFIELIVFAFEIEIHNFFRYLQKTSKYYDWDTITIILFYWIVGNQTLNFKGIVY